MSFVCQNKPFVGTGRGCKIPFISYLEPFVGFTRGFTLTELVTVLAVAGILVTVAVPSLTNFLRTNRLTTITNDLIADFQVARSEAIKRGADVIVCNSNNQSSCTGGSWADGWILFADVDGSGSWTQTASQEDVLVKKREALPAGTVINASSSIVIFNRQGLLANSAAGSYTVCDPNLKKAKVINLQKTGRTALLPEVTC